MVSGQPLWRWQTLTTCMPVNTNNHKHHLRKISNSLKDTGNQDKSIKIHIRSSNYINLWLNCFHHQFSKPSSYFNRQPVVSWRIWNTRNSSRISTWCQWKAWMCFIFSGAMSFAVCLWKPCKQITASMDIDSTSWCYSPQIKRIQYSVYITNFTFDILTTKRLVWQPAYRSCISNEASGNI